MKIDKIKGIIRRFEESSSYENEDIEEESEEIPYSYCKYVGLLCYIDYQYY